MAHHYKVQVQVDGEWVYPDEDWDYVFDGPTSAKAWFVRVQNHYGLPTRMYEADRYEAIVNRIDEGAPIIAHFEAFDTPERGREGVARLRKQYAAPAYDVWLYDTLEDVKLGVQ